MQKQSDSPENDGRDNIRHAQSGVEPDELGVRGDDRDPDPQDGAEGVGEEEHGHDETLHAGGGLGEGVLETGDTGEDFRQPEQHVPRGLHGDVDVVAVAARGGHVVVGRAAVNFVLDDCREGHAEPREDEAPCDPGDGVHGETSFAEEGINNFVHDGDEDDDDDGVDVLHFVVGHAVELHGAGLGDEVGVQLVVDDPVDGVEDEDLAGHQRPTDLVDEGLVPGRLVFVAVGGLVGGPRGVHTPAANQTNPHRLEGVREDGPLGRASDVKLASEDEGGEADAKGDETHQIDGPEALVFLHKDGGDQAQRADVDAPVEDHIDALVGDAGILDDAFAALEGLDLQLGLGHLLGDQGADVGLDAAGAQPDDDHGGGEAAEGGAVVDGKGQGGDEEDEEAADVDDAEDHDGFVPAQILIGHDGSDDGGHVAPELEEILQTGGEGGSLPDGAGQIAVGVGGAAVVRVDEVVVEGAGDAVITEPLGELDDADKEGARRQCVRHWSVLVSRASSSRGRVCSRCILLPCLRVAISSSVGRSNPSSSSRTPSEPWEVPS